MYVCIGVRPLIISGTVDQFPGGDVELTFTSTINRASYECLLLSNDTDTPLSIDCKLVSALLVSALLTMVH